jgi:CheY-like chemotaxis protein
MNRPILYLEDVSSDAQLAMTEFKRLGVADRVIHMPDGNQLLAYLSGITRPVGVQIRTTPALIILDLGMPEVHGMQLLNLLRSRRNFRRIPVVVFSGSEDPAMVAAAYEAGACSFVWKSTNASEFCQAIDGIIRYWTTLNRVPEQ